MPNPGENFSSSAGERAGENPRETYERRGEKVLQAMSVEEIMSLPRSELEKFSLEEILAAKAKLETEYQTRYGAPYEPAEQPAEAPSAEAEPETAPIPATNAAESAPASTAESGTSIVDTAIDSTTPTTAGVAAVDIATGAPSYDTPSSSSSAESNPTPSEVVTSEEGTSETVTSEEASARAEEVRRKKNPRFRRFVGRAATAALITLASFGVGTKVFAPAQKNIPTTESTTLQKDDNTKRNEKAEAEKIGIKDGYGEKGMWLSENKSGPYAFADATEVAEVCDNDECEMIKYTAREESEAFADYLAHLPESMQPEGFKGLTILETESKLESLSDEDYETLQTQFEGTMDKAFTRTVTVNGKQRNAYMRLKDESGSVTHGNMELVSCVTDENNLEVTQFYWTDADGNEIGSMNIKMQPVYDDNGNITSYKLCMQAISSIDSPVYEGLNEINEPPVKTGSEGTNKTGSEGTEKTGSEGTNKTGSEGTGSEGTGSEGTGSEGTGSEGTEHTPKNEEAEKKNAGDRVDRRELDQDVTPKTSEDQDKENFKSIEKQKHDDEAKQAKDQETKRDQDKKESEAKEKAEERRQEEAKKEEKKSEPEKKHEEERKKEADHSAEKAKEHSSSEQKESAKHEEKAREESKAREEKQSEANKAEPKHEKEASEKKDDNKEERKNTMEEGDF